MSRIEQLQEMLQKSPRDDFLLYGLAIEHAKHGQHEAALTYFDRAIEADAANAYHYFHKARSLEARERLDDARLCGRVRPSHARLARPRRSARSTATLR
jgi:Flp pilus assembly protein TadD